MAAIPGDPSPNGSDLGPASSQPAHPVFVDAFATDATGVTLSAFAEHLAQLGAALVIGSEFGSPDRLTRPAIGLLWVEGRHHCHSRGARLSIEAERENAARGTDGRSYPSGAAWEASRSSTSDGRPGHPLPLGSFPEGTSPYGLCEMADHFDPAYHAWAPTAKPTGPT